MGIKRRNNNNKKKKAKKKKRKKKKEKKEKKEEEEINFLGLNDEKKRSHRLSALQLVIGEAGEEIRKNVERIPKVESKERERKRDRDRERGRLLVGIEEKEEEA